MRARQGEHHRLLQQQIDDKPFLTGDRRADERRIDPFIAQVIDELRSAAFLQREQHQRKGLPVRANDTRYEGMKGGRARESYGDLSLLAARGAFGRRECMVDMG